ncbi:hypothetical protein WOLCODRAFT_132061 [Wolfiporia cocos MD-104 SS10]|uniref:Coilin n=1 Tax=Wolfiporia cocos (strain MD-104) TaxID=742152 RepID=A0A2H3JHL1_WOLCO|nr:hypothetical protein WOLCODRAFT_132061 [Wolfiporia cocos MD-104 SS10]
MRVKVESVHPLPTVKAWFSVHSATNIEALKEVLCSDLHTLQTAQIRARDITLVLDDFELLDPSPIDVVRDGDLIVYRIAHATVNKRKALLDDPGTARKREKRASSVTKSDAPPTWTVPGKSQHTKQLAHKKPAITRTSSRTESSSDSTSESDSDSDTSGSSSELEEDPDSESESSSQSESDSDSDSSSDTDSSSSVEFAARSTDENTSARKQTHNAAADALNRAESAPAIAPAPPGFGKPSTKSRNVRRRRKRMHERLAATVEPASVNEIPLGARAQKDEYTMAAAGPSTERAGTLQSATPHFMMASLQNKNKRKGFKNAMSQSVPAKIVFASTEDVDEDVAPAVDSVLQNGLPFANTNDREVFRAANARLVPPSEKQEQGVLPPNMFVTSIDVEEGVPQKKRRKQKQTQARANIEEYERYADAEEEIVLPYNDPQDDVPESQCVVTTAAGIPDPQAVEAKWEWLTRITNRSQVKPGMILGWRELGINPATFTPEMLLKLGRVIRCDDQLAVEVTLENGALAFGGIVGTEEAEAVEENYEWSNIMETEWRIVRGESDG